MLGSHLLGIYEKAFNPKDTWETRLRKAKKLGFDYLEISIDEKDERISRLFWSKAGVEALRRISEDVGLPITSMCLSAHRRFPFGSADPTTRYTAHDIMRRAIEFSCALGIRTIQLAGYDVYYENSTPESVARFGEGMQWASELAEKHQVMLGMEIMDTPFMNSITKHLRYEKSISSPWYKVYPDLGNLSAWPENDPGEELEKGISSVVAIHLKDTVPPGTAYPGKFKCVDFGAGCVDFEARFRQLEQLNYKGPYMVEMWYADGSDDEKQISRSVQWLREQYSRSVK